MSKTYNTDLQTNNTNLQAILDAVNALPEASSSVTLPELSNPATAAQILLGYEAIDGTGNKITGTIPTKAATTITPTTEEQVAVSAGTYCTGDIKVSAVESSGSGSGSETCTITVVCDQDYGYVVYSNNDGVHYTKADSMNHLTIECLCLCGSLIVIGNSGGGSGYISDYSLTSNIEEIMRSAYDDVLYLRAPTTANDTGEISFSC